MLEQYGIHTDLALEDKERFESDNVKISGVSVEEVYDSKRELKVTRVRILTENGAKIMGKPVGTYITMEAPQLAALEEDTRREIAGEMALYLREMLMPARKGQSVLVVGLGNREVTPDALGPDVIEKLHVTRHMIREFGKYAADEWGAYMVSAIAPGVTAQTGMETLEIVRGIVREAKPDFVLVIDALAARNTKRLNRTIQIADTGICPGSGVGNHRKGMTRETLGVPVIAIGVPTVVDAATIVRDTMEHVIKSLDCREKFESMDQMIAPHLHGMFVTPKDIDETIGSLGSLIAETLNMIFLREKEA